MDRRITAVLLLAALCTAACGPAGGASAPRTPPPIASAPPAQATPPPQPAPEIDPALADAIARVPLIDDHAHPQKLVAEGEEDADWDALSYEGMEDFNLPVRIFPISADYVAAWKGLWGYPYDDASQEHVAWLAGARAAAKKEHGDGYSAWVLDRIGVEAMLANRVVLGRGLEAPRFRFVSYVDALILPFDTSAIAQRSPDAKTFLPGLVKRRNDLFAALHVAAPPATLADYVAKVVTPALARTKDAGALAIKFESAYFRSLRFGNPTEAEARAVYERYARGGAPSQAEYDTLQDYLFREIARRAGEIGLAVHVHVAWGPGSYYRMQDTLSLALEPVFDDPSLRKTRFVMIHGGWPDTAHAGLLMMKPNVWVDFSWQSLVRYPRALSATLREWLELDPEKVLYGSDAFGNGARAGWEERAWVAAATARRALGIALAGMIADGEIDKDRAIEIAHLVLHDNAAKLYGIGPK